MKKYMGQSSSIYYSSHAFTRACERISITAEDIINIIKWEKFIYIGAEPKTNRVHLLFYSVKDSQCFVLIEDEVTNTIITILPLDYHQLIAWAVSLESQKQARELILGKKFSTVSNVVPENIHGNNFDFFHVSAVVNDEYGKYLGIKKLGKFNAVNFHHDEYQMVKSELFINEILMINNNLVDERKTIDTLLIRHKNKSDIEPIVFSLSDLLYWLDKAA